MRFMKKRFSVSIDEELVNWIDERVKDKTFSNKSHGLEFCVQTVKDIPERNFLTMNFLDKTNGKVIDEKRIYVPDQLLENMELIMNINGFKTHQELFDYIDLSMQVKKQLKETQEKDPVEFKKIMKKLEASKKK